MSFSLPITRTGKSNIVPPPPWYYGVTYIGVHVKFSSVNDIVPEMFDPEGEGWIYIAEFISTSEHTWEYMYADPELTQYMEGAIGVKVNFRGKSYLYYPFMWVDKDWALVRGWIDGYPKKIAKISMTKLHPLLPKYNKPVRELTLGGYAVRGSAIIKLQVSLTEKVDKTPIQSFGPLINIRRFPSRGDGEDDVYEIVSRVRDESVMGEIWRGDGKVELRGSINDEINLELDKVYGGYYFTQYFKVTTTTLLEKIPAKKA
ncbi:acetoacetate decarboxylase [Candidatus Acidianus copahuensis]|uniref:Acetoacetate decarboxylase n=1 Tax=Candidatus Acidianus copahuensis TaxID=1160895 RepID=A0A031LU84_9CREN|nr:acetoacetate decarboxylase family protein [Candidatus Acidianus copahuensis]EZQ11386.1 acetoacetate decarboxylase [Candidatus Acidianus copahuensis]